MENEKRTIFKGIKLTPSEWAKIQEAAKKAERKDAEFIRIATMRYIEIIEKAKS